MERFEYIGRTIDIFTAIKNGQWTWAFTVDEGLAQASRSGGFESAPSAARAVKEEARRRIDEQPCIIRCCVLAVPTPGTA